MLGAVNEGGAVEFLLHHGLTVFGQWISIAELLGQVFALAVVFLAQRRTLWTWPVQVGATVLLFSVYISAHLGGLATRQVAILAISVYGWWAWSRRSRITRPNVMAATPGVSQGTSTIRARATSAGGTSGKSPSIRRTFAD